MAFASIAKYIQPPYVHSPLNYTGGKYKLLNSIIPMLPKPIDTFVDMFAGGLNVGANVKCNHLIANDICKPIIELYEYFKQTPLETILAGINEIRNKYNLSMSNSEGYYKLREDYNKNPSPLGLFMLCCCSFNHHIRFNSSGNFNVPHGYNKSSFNDSIHDNLVLFCKALKSKVSTFVSMDFRNLLDSLPTITAQNGGGYSVIC